jgi:hypothetical protein
MVVMEITLVESLEKSNYPEGCYTLRNLSLNERVEWVKGVFSLACKNYSFTSTSGGDEKAVMFLHWFLHAMEDLENEGISEESRDKIALKSSRVRNIISVFPEIPMSAFPVMPKTKEFAFSEIVGWCYETNDEEESDELFRFCCSREFNCSEDEKLLEKIFKEKTDAFVSPSRLSRHLLIANSEIKEWEKNRLARPKIQIDRIGKAIFNAWIRNSLGDVGDMASVVRVIQPLQGASDEALKYLGEYATKIAEIDKKYAGEPYSIISDFSVAHPAKSKSS